MDRFQKPDPQTRPSGLPPRVKVLLKYEMDDAAVARARELLDAAMAKSEQDRESDAGTIAGAERYRVRTSWEHGGPKWDPYAEEQSTAARVQSHRRSRTRPEVPSTYDRWAAHAKQESQLTHYQLLGVRPDAPLDQIERAYRRYAASIHPDKFFDDPEARLQAERKMRELNAIMQTLRDPNTRALYDSQL
jgi:DnaJ-domain-containing protein 1